MNSDDPIGFFITWTVYGTHLQGDERGWRRRGRGHQPPQPQLEQWHRTRLKQAIVLLNPDQRTVVETECQRHCTTNVSFLVGLRKFFCFKVAFIAPREVSRSRVRCRLLKMPSTHTRLTSRGAMKATLVAAKGRAVIIEAGDDGPSTLARITCMPLSPPWDIPVPLSVTN